MLMMSAEQVLAMLGVLARASIVGWVDGGWGIDALLGKQTREHDDLDLVMAGDAVDEARAVLEGQGFTVERDWLPTALSLRHPDGRSLDLHPVESTPDGGGDQIQRDGSRWHYDAPVTGRIAGHSVRCCSPACQVAAHLGYEPDDTDRADMTALAARYRLTLPMPYQAG